MYSWPCADFGSSPTMSIPMRSAPLLLVAESGGGSLAYCTGLAEPPHFGIHPRPVEAISYPLQHVLCCEVARKWMEVSQVKNHLCFAPWEYEQFL